MAIPLWKVKREIVRMFQRARAFPEGILTSLFGARYYDIFLANKVATTDGRLPKKRRRAIYLIFPADGLLASHERCLRYLNKKGLATTVVSNLPLEPNDKARVLELCSTYIERPNFGYDFGGYRDGVLSLQRETAEIDQLVLLNDSCWFPIVETTDWLDDIDDLNVDFGAAVSNYGLRRVDPEGFLNFEFSYSTDHPNFHYCSYALSFGPRVIQHPGFLRYWQSFPLSNSKKRTVRRGEIGLTQWAIRNGMTHGCTFDIANMDKNLASLPEERLREIASMLLIMDDRRMRQVQARVVSTMEKMPEKDVIAFILTSAARKGVSYATADFNISDQGFPFLKKSPVWLEEDTYNKTLQILRALDAASAKEALQEAEKLQTRHFQKA